MASDASDRELRDRHLDEVAREILAGRVVPFLGAGANLSGRPVPAEVWKSSSEYLPSGAELAEHIAGAFGYPEADSSDLIRVSQFAATMEGEGPLYEELRVVFDTDYRLTTLHRFLARLPGLLRDRGVARYPVIVTTNYDDALDRAFREVGEPFDLVWYVADQPKEHRGRFMHRPPDGEPIRIEVPNEYRGLSPDTRTVILKIHGAIDRTTADLDSYVITEDHYIDYLTHTDISSLIPVTLTARLKRSHFLFLGYSLRDWNLRVILHRIWGDQSLPYKSWAIQLEPKLIDREFWRKRDVNILSVPLDEYVEGLNARLQLPATQGPPSA